MSERRIFTRAQLRASGLTRAGLERALREGELMRLRRDTYAAPELSEPEQAALRAGARLGCISALAAAGIWVTQQTGIHVHVAPNASRLGNTRGFERVHWDPLIGRPLATRVAIIDALRAAMVCLPHIDAVATVDSALQLGLVRRSDLVPICRDPRRAAVLRDCDRRAQSGLESILRVVLRKLGLRVEVQVVIPGVGRVDLLVEGTVIVETDGSAFHSGPRRHVDHQRDAAAAGLGYTPLRFDPLQVHAELRAVVMAVIGAVEAHRNSTISGSRARRLRDRAARTLRPENVCPDASAGVPRPSASPAQPRRSAGSSASEVMRGM